MNLTLYYAPIACPLVPLIALNESGEKFEVRPISLKNGQQKTPEYLKINPKGKVPTLVIDGEPLTENVAILTFLAGAFAKAKLLPADSRDSIRALSLMAFCASGIHPHLARINAPARFCDAPGSEDSVRRLAAAEVSKAFAVIEPMLAGREWVFGQWTAVDAYLFWVWRRAGQLKVDRSPFRNLNAHGERMMQRPSVQRALAFEAEVLAQAEKAA